MKREEAIEALRRLPIGLMDLSYEQKSDLTEALNIALAALRGPTREQVENLQGEWLFPIFVGQKEANDPRCQCSECGSIETPLARHRFCPSCGAPMTDEAVDIVMERLEALNEIPTAT